MTGHQTNVQNGRRGWPTVSVRLLSPPFPDQSSDRPLDPSVSHSRTSTGHHRVGTFGLPVSPVPVPELSSGGPSSPSPPAATTRPSTLSVGATPPACQPCRGTTSPSPPVPATSSFDVPPYPVPVRPTQVPGVRWEVPEWLRPHPKGPSPGDGTGQRHLPERRRRQSREPRYGCQRLVHRDTQVVRGTPYR